MICLVEGKIEREEKRLRRTCLHDENSRTIGTQTFEEKRFPRFSFGSCIQLCSKLSLGAQQNAPECCSFSTFSVDFPVKDRLCMLSETCVENNVY